MRFLAIFLLIPILLVDNPAKAELIIEFGEFGEAQMLATNATTSVNVYIRSNGGNVTLALAEYRFKIDLAPLSATPSGIVQFLPDFDQTNLPSLQNNAEQFDSNYIFFNKTTINNFKAIRQNATEIFGFDSTFDVDAGMYVDSMIEIGVDQKLLARLEIEQAQLGGGASGTYQIALTEGNFQTADQANDEFGSIDFSSTPGTLQVGITAVPEPSSILLLTSGLALAATKRWWRRSHRQAPLTLKS